MAVPSVASAPVEPKVLQNLRRVAGSREIQPARVLLGGHEFLLHGDGKVYALQVHDRPVPGKPGYVQRHETQRRAKDGRLVRMVQETYKRLRPA